MQTISLNPACREHVNRIVFLPEAGLLDPVLDVVLASGDLRAIVAGRGSAWQVDA